MEPLPAAEDRVPFFPDAMWFRCGNQGVKGASDFAMSAGWSPVVRPLKTQKEQQFSLTLFKHLKDRGIAWLYF